MRNRSWKRAERKAHAAALEAICNKNRAQIGRLENLVKKRDADRELIEKRLATLEKHLYALLNKLGDRVETSMEELRTAPEYTMQIDWGEDDTVNGVVFEKRPRSVKITEETEET